MHVIKRTTAFVALAIAASALSCTTTAKVMSLPGIAVNARSLERDEYVVLGDAEGRACVEETCLFGVFCSVKSESGDAADATRLEGRLFTTDVQTSAPNAVVPGFVASAGTEGNTSAAEQAALFRAIESMPDADALLAPRKNMQMQSSSTLFSSSIRACVRVSGKGIRLKTDAEIAAARAPVPSAPASTPTTPTTPTMEPSPPPLEPAG